MALPEFAQLVSQAKKEIQEIAPDELAAMKERGENFALIDVREPDETAKGTIPGAVPIPRGVLELRIDEVTADKDKKIVVYCAGGGRSALAASNLQKMGFRNVLSLAQGFGGWSASKNK